MRWNVLSNTLIIIVSLIQTIVLARILPIEFFGIYALSLAAVLLSSELAKFGMGAAILHLDDGEEGQVDKGLFDAFFTLQALFALIWLAVFILGIAAFVDEHRLPLMAIAVSYFFVLITVPLQIFYVKIVQHRVLSLMRFVIAMSGALAAILVAYWYQSLWSLVMLNILEAVVACMIMFGVSSGWKPKLSFDGVACRKILSFGSKQFSSVLGLRVIERGPDLFVGSQLGAQALGLYSRAHQFSNFPGRVLAIPVEAVVRGVFSELKGSKEALNHYFFAVCSTLLVGAFLIGGGVFVISEELFTALLGERWLPMLPVFHLLIIYSLLNPVMNTFTSLIVVVGGDPLLITRVRLLQIGLLGLGCATLGSLLGIQGVALSVDIMLLVGFLWVYVAAKKYVDINLSRLLCSLILTFLVSAYIAFWVPVALGFEGIMLPCVKLMVYSLVFSLLLWIFNRECIGAVSHILTKR